MKTKTCDYCESANKIIDDEYCGACGMVQADAQHRCPNCAGDDLVFDHSAGDYLCRGCGMVLEGCTLDESPEWSAIQQNEESRCGPSSHANDLVRDRGTIKLDCSRAHRSVKSIQRYHEQMNMNYQQRSLLSKFDDIAAVCETIRLPESIIFQAKEMYRDVREARISRGPVHDALVAACVYYACKVQRQEGVSRERKEVARAFGIERMKTMSDACKLFKVITRGKAYHAALFDTTGATDLVHRVMGAFRLDRDARIAAMRDIRRLDDSIRSSGIMDGKSPNSTLAVILCIVFDNMRLDIAKKDIADQCDTTVVTLNKMLELIRRAAVS